MTAFSRKPPLSDAQSHVLAHINDFVALRHELHAAPELAFHEYATTARIAALLESCGYGVERLTQTGLIATLQSGDGPRLGLRADIDALPITEATGLSYASKAAGVMHACGHDGHSAILLAAAHSLAKRKAFRGTLHLIFQPAEEIGAGAKALLDAGLFSRFPMDAIFGLHNWPGLDVGRFGFVEGPAMAAIDKIEARIYGRGGHGAEPHLATDPVLVAAHAVTALQSVVSRNVDPRQMAVVTVGALHAGEANNVIPDSAEMKLTLRSYAPEVRDLLKVRVPQILHGVSAGFGARAQVEVYHGFPAVINHPAQTALIRRIAAQVLGDAAIEPDFAPRTASEDFAYYLQQRPGAFIFCGNGDSAPLHSPEYRFNDDAIAPAASLWVALAEDFLGWRP